jgi:hypothetical protein
MRLPFCASALAVFIVALFGCAPLAVDYDYDTTFDFAKLKTYDWAPSPPGSDKEELTAKRFEQAVNSQLQAKGYTRMAGSPDFLITMEGVRKTVTGGSVGVGASISVPVGSHGSMSLGGGRSKPRVKQEGTLYLNFVNPGTNALIWQGSATAEIREKISPEEQQQLINQVVAEILKNFPPKGK